MTINIVVVVRRRHETDENFTTFSWVFVATKNIVLGRKYCCWLTGGATCGHQVFWVFPNILKGVVPSVSKRTYFL